MKFNEILGSYVYKPDGKVTLVPDSDKMRSNLHFNRRSGF